MDNSILNNIKKLLGFDPEYTAFDTDIIIHINSVFSIMHQIGAAPPDGFMITDATATWDDFLEGKQNVEFIKSYIFLRVKIVFDPPANSFGLDALNKVIDEMTWRLNILEIVFNPDVYVPPTGGNGDAMVYEIEETDSPMFPEEAQNGDVGFDEDTGDLWRLVE